MNRRTFIKAAAGTGLAAGLSGCSWLGLGGPLVRADLAAQAETEAIPPNLDREEMEILKYASLAPSGHNAQPWFVKVQEPGKWLIGLDRDRRLPMVDPRNREALLSIGAFVENLALAAGALGRPAEIRVLEDRPVEKGFVQVAAAKGATWEYPLKRLALRRTVKHGFGPDPLQPAHLKALSRHLEDCIYYFPRGSAHSDCIAEGTVESFRAQTKRDEAMIESAEWTRLSNKEARQYRDGLTPAGMEISGFAGFWVRNFMDSKDAAGQRFRDAALDLTAKLVGEGGGWLVLTGPSESPADLIETGRRFQRMALLLREMSLAVQPMTQILEEKVGQEAFGANHPGSIKPQFILRVGYLKKYPDPVSLRRPVGWFVKT